MVANKWDIITDKTGVEGGYVNNSDDLGGETIWGITRTTANEWQQLWSKHHWDGKDMRLMPKALAYEIYDLGWWKKMYLDEIFAIDAFLADKLFDFGINAGRLNCIKSLQRVLNVSNRKGKDYPDLVVDGGMGPKSLNAIKTFISLNGKSGRDELMMMMISMQNYHYLDISEKREANESFTNGWRKRVYRDFVIYAKALVGVS